MSCFHSISCLLPAWPENSILAYLSSVEEREDACRPPMGQPSFVSQEIRLNLRNLLNNLAGV